MVVWYVVGFCFWQKGHFSSHCDVFCGTCFTYKNLLIIYENTFESTLEKWGSLSRLIKELNWLYESVWEMKHHQSHIYFKSCIWQITAAPTSDWIWVNMFISQFFAFTPSVLWWQNLSECWENGFMHLLSGQEHCYIDYAFATCLSLLEGK